MIYLEVEVFQPSHDHSVKGVLREIELGVLLQ
jgi:hypothetical protein